MRCVLVAMAMLAGCVQTSTIQCGELTCPATWVCTPSGTSCVPQDAAEACDDIADNDPCETAGLDGVCNAGICEVIICGNLRVDPGEACDDGNITAGDGCNPTCRSDETCGNGVVDPLEGCDCGEGMAQNSACTMQNSDDPDAECRPDCRPHGCGDDVVHGTEQCEQSLGVGTTTCATFGYYEGDLACASSCTFDTSSCDRRCGDGAVNGDALHPEACDMAPPTESCLDYGFDAGRMACTSFCTPGFDHCQGIGWRQNSLDTWAFTSVWGASATNVWFGGLAGRMARWDGATWSSLLMPGVGALETIHDLWGPNDTKIFAVHSTKIVEIGATTFTEVADTVTDSLYAIGGVPGFALAVGVNGAIMKWNGTAWSVMPSGTDAYLNDVLVLAPDLAFVVGETADDTGSVIRKWDGSTWADVPAPITSRHASIWGPGPDDLYVGGESLMHWDGTRWSTVPLGIKTAVLDINGSSASDVWVTFDEDPATGISIVAHFDGQVWSRLDTGLSGPSAIWSAAPGAAFAASQRPARYLGNSWLAIDTADVTLRALSGASTSDLMAVGERGMVLRYSAGSWRAVPSELATKLNGVSRGIVVGDWGTLGVFDGTRVVAHSSGTREHLHAVWAASSADAWIVGDNGVLVHFDGTTATFERSPTVQTLRAIWGFAANDIYAVGDGGTIIHYDGAGWAVFDSETTASLNSIWGSSPDDFWVVGATSTVRRWTGRWTPYNPSGGLEHDYTGVFGTSATDVVFAYGQSFVRRWNGSAFSTELPPRAVSGFGGVGIGVAATYVAFGADLALLRRPAAEWVEALEQFSSIFPYHDVYAAAPDDVYLMVGNRLVHFDGFVWSHVDTGASQHTFVDGIGPTAVFALNDGNTLSRWNGNAWATQIPNTNTSQGLEAIAGRSANEIWGVGVGGTIRSFNGTSWSVVASGTSEQLHDVWVDSTTGTAIAVGRSATALRWNGSAWLPIMPQVAMPLTTHFTGVWGTSETDVYASNTAGTVLRWDGSSWTETPSANLAFLNGVVGLTSTDIFAVGYAGTLQHYDGGQWRPVRTPTSAAMTSVDLVGKTLYITTVSTGPRLMRLHRDVAW